MLGVTAGVLHVCVPPPEIEARGEPATPAHEQDAAFGA
jgi:hypothetical protein